MRLAGMTLGYDHVPRRIYTPLERGAGATEPLLVSFTLCNPGWLASHLVSSLSEFKDQYLGQRQDGRAVYSYKAFTHVVPRSSRRWVLFSKWRASLFAAEIAIVRYYGKVLLCAIDS